MRDAGTDLPAEPPLLTVGIPAFNESASLSRSLNALKANVPVGSLAFTQVEILVLDDGSADGTAALARSLIGSSGRVVTHPNQGRAATRRAILEQARGEYVLMLDAHVELGPDVLAWWLDARDRHPVINGDVSVELNSPYAQFWDTLTTFGWRAYLTKRRPVSFGLEDFDQFPKGTGMFLAPRAAWLEAYADSGLDGAQTGAVVSDDTRLLRALAAKHRIWLHPQFRGVYFSPRTTFAQFMSNARYRGETFVDSYWESPSVVGRATRGLPAAGGVSLAAATLVTRRSPSAAAGLATTALAAQILAVAGMAVSGGKPARQAAISAVIAPAFSVAFGSGLIRGYITKLGLGWVAAPGPSSGS